MIELINNQFSDKAYLNTILEYNKITGLFKWKKDRGGKAKKGTIAGHLHSSGYRYIHIGNNYFRAHRLAWYFVYGEWPADMIDHINRNRDDNRIENLRILNNSDNKHNSGPSVTNKTGVRGVNFHKASNKYIAQISIDNKKIYLGVFNTIDEATIARKNAELKYKSNIYR